MKDPVLDFMEYLSVERNASINTRLGYLSDLRQFEGFLSPDAAPGADTCGLLSVTEADVTAFVYWLHGGCKKGTAARKLSSVRSFYRFLVRKGRVAGNPAEL